MINKQNAVCVCVCVSASMTKLDKSTPIALKSKLGFKPARPGVPEAAGPTRRCRFNGTGGGAGTGTRSRRSRSRTDSPPRHRSSAHPTRRRPRTAREPEPGAPTRHEGLLCDPEPRRRLHAVLPSLRLRLYRIPHRCGADGT